MIIETVARSESLQNLLWLNISELSVIKNVTANYLKRVIFFSFTTLQYTKNALITGTKINLIFKKHTSLLPFCVSVSAMLVSMRQKNIAQVSILERYFLYARHELILMGASP